MSLAPNAVPRPVWWKHLTQLGSRDVATSKRLLRRFPHFQRPSVRFPPEAERAIVGKSLLLSDVELRSFQVRAPWSENAAWEYGHDAKMAWRQENSPLLWTCRLYSMGNPNSP